MTPHKGRSIAILLDNSPSTWSSRDAVVVEICRAWVRRSVTPILVFSERPPRDLDVRYRSTGAEVISLSYRDGLLRYYRDLGTLIQKYSVDRVHICFFDYFSLVPWLVWIHGVRSIVFEMVNSGELKARSWKLILLRLRTRLTAFPVSRVMAISEYVRRQLVAVGMPEEKLAMVHHGVDPVQFAPDPSARESLAAEFTFRGDELILVTICRLVPGKDVPTLIEACRLLAARGVAVRLLVAGDGPLRLEMEALSRRSGLTGRVHFLGHYGYPDRLLKGCDLFVLASVGEAFGLVLAEAMACEVPVVASRHGAIPEIVEDGRTGLLANPRDAGAFADAIQRLAEAPALRRRMGRQGRERVLQSFTAEMAAANTIAVHEALDAHREKALACEERQ